MAIVTRVRVSNFECLLPFLARSHQRATLQSI
jgi:hypothetical protein